MTTNDETLHASEKSGETTDPGSAAPEGQDTAAASATAERDQLRDQLLRTAADFDNYRKRTRREIDDAKVRGREDAIKDILPVFDNLERAVMAAESAQTVASVVEGVKMVLKLFEDTAERMGLNRVKTKGERFDPAIHEAIQQQETDEHPPGTILTEIVPGYMVGQRLLRAAMVVVARKPSGKPATDGGEGDVSRVNGAAEGSGNGHTA
ncbi:MAG: nucleotide exchange factor GrpE [Polyangiales bacterium]